MFADDIDSSSRLFEEMIMYERSYENKFFTQQCETNMYVKIDKGSHTYSKQLINEQILSKYIKA